MKKFPKKTTLLIIINFLLLSVHSQCYYLIDMQDSYGDGWNGGSVEVNINGVFVSNFTFTNGNASVDSISSLNGDVVDFYFVSGDWDTEITFQVYDPSGTQILDIGPFADNDGNDGFLISDTSNSTCSPQFVDVTFQIDMSKVTSAFSIPEINGSWNNYCGDCDPMVDPDGDNIWETTISLFTGNYEFIFSADSLNIQENIASSLSCTNGSVVLPRRIILVGAQEIIMPIVCWESCQTCNDFPQPPIGISCNIGNASTIFSDNCESQGNWTGDYGTGNGIWQVNSGETPTGGTGPDNAYSGTSYFFFESSTWGNGGVSQFDTATIYSPMIDLTNSNDDAELTFWMHGRGSSVGYLNVGLSNNINGPFTKVYSQYGETHTAGNSPWSQIGINISDYIGQTLYVSFTYIRFTQGNPEYTGDLAIDLLEVNTCSTCPSPQSFLANNITPNSAEFNWTPAGNESEWMISYNGINIFTTNIPTTISNLSPNTNYDCFIKAVCGINDTSSQSSLINFSTECSYNLAPINENFDLGFSQCWSQEQQNDDFDWTLQAGPTPSNQWGTGPNDDVIGGGSYMFTEASNPREDGDLAILYSEPIDLINLSNPQLTFYTHMYGSAVGELQIDIFDGSSYLNIFNKSGDYGDIWIKENILLNPSSNLVHFRIIGILGENNDGETWPGDIAIDEFSINDAITDDIEVLSGKANSACDLSINEQVNITLVNKGLSTQNNFLVSYKINGGNPVIETFSSNLNHSDTVLFNFTTNADLSNDGVYNFEFECLLPNDQNISDNIYIIMEENYQSPSDPITTDDTICFGETIILESTSNEGIVNWYSDSNGSNLLINNEVSPTSSTTYYAQVQGADVFLDDFDGYPSGALIAQQSPFWTTPFGGGTQYDALISNSQMLSGNNSIYLNYLNDDDLYLPFNQGYNSGLIELSFDLYVGTTANVNLQTQINPSNQYLLQLKFNPSGLMEFDIGTTTLIGSYPGQNMWCNIKLKGDLNTQIWSIYVNDLFQGGAAINNGNEIGSINFKPNNGDEFYIDNMKWHAYSDDDCLSSLSPKNINVEFCSSVKENKKVSLQIYPNPSNDEIKIICDKKIIDIEILDFKGRSIFKAENIESNSKILLLNFIERGGYLLKINTDSGSITKKIIIN